MNDTGSRLDLKLALPSVFLISLSVLAFEVALTGVFSVMLSYHFVFAIVSAAMLGLGAGGLLFKRWGAALPERAVWVGALAYSLSLAGSVTLILTLPLYASQALAPVRFWVYVALAVVPFAAAGFAVSGLFQRLPEKSPFIYGVDLLGAATGALAVVPAMDALGAVNVVLLLATVAAVAALLLGVPRRRRALPSLAALVLLGALFGASVASGAGISVPITNDRNKEMFGMLADPANEAKVVESRWSSFGRTDLVKSDLDPNEMWIFVDGAAGSPMYNLDALLKDPQQRMQFTMHSGESFPFAFLKDNEKRTALVLGPGGGRDVLVALLGGVKSITAVEVNPDVVKIVKQYKDFDGGIYSGRPGVKAIVGEGRNFVRTTDKKYDLIMASIPVTKSSRSVEGYALTENNLFTVQAFQDYLKHLTENGRLIIVAHNDAEIIKLVSLALAAFGKEEIPEAEAMKHLYTVASDMMPAIVVQKQPLSAAEAKAMHGTMHQDGFDKGALFIPWIKQQAIGPLRMFDQALVDVSNGSRSLGELTKTSGLDLRAPTDDRPFFYNFERGLPSPFRAFAILTALSALAVVALVTLRRKGRADPLTFIGALRQGPALKLYLVVFFALGIGYTLVEIAFFQKLTLYIGQPQMALTVLLFSLLLGSGIGSLLTSALSRRRLRAGAAVSLCVALLVTALVFLFPQVFAIGVDPRIAAAIILVPLGVLMGCPFPLAVRGLRGQGAEHHTSVMWGVNGAASVFGSALSMTMGTTWGFSSALFAGAVAYGGVAVLFAALSLVTEKQARSARHA